MLSWIGILKVIHIKRFQCSARWREKIRTVVLFPHSGLDMSGFVSSNSAHRNQVRLQSSRVHVGGAVCHRPILHRKRREKVGLLFNVSLRNHKRSASVLQPAGFSCLWCTHGSFSTFNDLKLITLPSGKPADRPFLPLLSCRLRFDLRRVAGKEAWCTTCMES